MIGATVFAGIERIGIVDTGLMERVWLVRWLSSLGDELSGAPARITTRGRFSLNGIENDTELSSRPEERFVQAVALLFEARNLVA